MKTRIIYTKIWKDTFFSELTNQEQLLFLYLLTNERTSLCGIYELPDREKMHDLKLNKSELDKAKNTLQENKKFLFVDDWVIIVNFEKYNNYSGEKNEKARENELNLIPKYVKDIWNKRYTIDRVSLNGDRVSGTLDRVSGTPDSLINHKSETINHKSYKGVVKGEKTPSQRMREFIESVNNCDDKYRKLTEELHKQGVPLEIARTELVKFVEYWTELNKSGTKQRWQMEKTFEVQRRLKNWFNNIRRFAIKEEKKGIVI